MANKITPRDVLDGLGAMLRKHKAGKRVQVDDIVLWVTRAKALIGKQAAQIEDLKAALALLKDPNDEPPVPVGEQLAEEQGAEQQPPAEEPQQ